MSKTANIKKGTIIFWHRKYIATVSKVKNDYLWFTNGTSAKFSKNMLVIKF